MPWVAFIVIAVLLLIGLIALFNAERLARLALEQVADSLGLEISTGTIDVRLGGMPTVVAHDLVARAPGVTKPLLTAERVLLSLPWSTLRARGKKLAFDRIEIDAPVLDMTALQAWLATRPETETRIPTVRNGVQVTDGVLLADGWRLDAVDISLPTLRPQHRVDVASNGLYGNGDTKASFDLQITLAQPASNSALDVSGHAVLQRPGWQVAADLQLSGVVQVDNNAWRIASMKLAADARYESGEIRAPFALGLAGPLRYSDDRLTLQPLGVAVRTSETNDNPIPSLDAHGSLVLQQQLQLQLDGALAGWPTAWPALPSPLDDANGSLPFTLRYSGANDLSDIAELHLQHGAADFQGRFRLSAISEWLDTDSRQSPLPPLEGHVTVPRIEAAGAVLEGVSITIDMDAIDEPATEDADTAKP